MFWVVFLDFCSSKAATVEERLSCSSSNSDSITASSRCLIFPFRYRQSSQTKSKTNLATANGRVIFHTSTLKKLTTSTVARQLPSRAPPTQAPIGSRRKRAGSFWSSVDKALLIYSSSRNWKKRAIKPKTMQAKKGNIVYALNATLLIPNPSQMTTFVGLPTKRTILAVFAAENSEMSHAIGLSFNSCM